MFGLVDCNNFYVSCERVFRPEWRKVPIAVLSNNDGCIVARSEEVKKLGYPMGVPYFKVKNQLARDGVIICSSNYALYGDLSQRVMTCLEDMTPKVETYSIDEAFLDLHGIDDLNNFSNKIVQTVKQWTSIPVSIGVAPTKTLAKIANRLSKKSPELAGVCVMNSTFPLNQVAVEDVWGIGRALSKKLRLMGIGTAQDIADMDVRMVRGKFGVTMERTVMELRGEAVIALDDELPDPKQIIVSRQFNCQVTHKQYLEQAVATYASKAAEKARKKKVYARVVQVFVQASHFAKGPLYINTASKTLLDARNDDLTLVKAAVKCLDAIWKDGYEYKKAGIFLTDLSSSKHRAIPIFGKADDGLNDELMCAMDKMNKRYGHGTLRLATTGIERPWSMKREFISPNYTTRWEDLPTAQA